MTPQQKKILVIASIAFGVLALCYAITRRCFKAGIEDGSGKESKKTAIRTAFGRKVRKRRLECMAHKSYDLYRFTTSAT